MKKFKKVFIPFIVLGTIFGIFQFVVIPMLNTSNTIANIFGAILGFITGFFLYTYFGVLVNGTPSTKIDLEILPNPNYDLEESKPTENPKPKRKYTKKPKQ